MRPVQSERELQTQACRTHGSSKQPSRADIRAAGGPTSDRSPLQEKKEARRELRLEPVEAADWILCSRPTAVCWSSAHRAGTSRVGLAGTDTAPSSVPGSRPARPRPASGATRGQPGRGRTTGPAHWVRVDAALRDEQAGSTQTPHYQQRVGSGQTPHYEQRGGSGQRPHYQQRVGSGQRPHYEQKVG